MNKTSKPETSQRTIRNKEEITHYIDSNKYGYKEE